MSLNYMKSPITGKPMEIRQEKRSFEYKGELFEVLFHYYKCSDTGEEFVTEQMGNNNLEQVYNAYRVKHTLADLKNDNQ